MRNFFTKNRITVPITLIELEENSYHILVEVLVNGVNRGFFVVDTGASKTVVDSGFIKDEPGEHDYSDVEMFSGGLGGDIPDMKIRKLDYLALGALTVKNQCVAMINLDNINNMYRKHCNTRIEGLLGSDILVKYNAVINYEKRIISFSL